MNRRDTVLSLLALGAVPLVAEAQQAVKVYLVGCLVAGSPTSHRISVTAFRDGLQKLGYIEGTNIKIEYRWAEGNLDRLPGLATELVQLKVDVIVAAGSSGAVAAKNATREIPVVMAAVAEPMELGLVASLARPEGNLTGTSTDAAATTSKRLQLLREAVPGIKRVAVVWNSTNPYAQRGWSVAQETAKVLGLALVSHEARTLEELGDTLATVPRAHPDSMIILNDPFVFTYRKTIAEAALRYRLPSVYQLREFVDSGGLMSYGANVSETYRRAASYVDKILKGAKPSDLPIEQPTKFELVINLKTAKALGITIPLSLLARADRVIE